MGSHISDDATLAVMDAVRHIVQVLRESSRAAEQHAGISGAQLFVLHTLAGAPAMTMNELAERTHTHQSSVSTVVSRLVEQRLVVRATSRSDARQRQLSLSPRGRRLAARAPDPAQARLIAAIEQLRPGKRRVLASTLSELTTALDGIRRAPPMFFERAPARPARRLGGARG